MTKQLNNDEAIKFRRIIERKF